MEDEEIVGLYWARDQRAIAETQKKYGGYCRAIAYNILGSFEDSEECVNDAFLRTWNSIPENRPKYLPAYIGRITRNIAIDKLARRRAKKRSAGGAAAVFEEMEACIPSSAGDFTEDIVIKDALNAFLASLSESNRKMFILRYWYFSDIKSIAKDCGFSESKVRTALMRLRKELKAYLEGEGIRL